MGFWKLSNGSTAAELVSWVVVNWECLGSSSSRAWRLRENSLFKLAVRMYLMFGTKNHKLCCNDSVFRRQQNQSTELNSTLILHTTGQIDRIENGFKYSSLLSPLSKHTDTHYYLEGTIVGERVKCESVCVGCVCIYIYILFILYANFYGDNIGNRGIDY